MHTSLPLARRDIIAHRLAEGQSVSASALAIEFNVSEDAVRRDLRALAAEGLCRRVYGGALPIALATAPMSARMDVALERKSALAKAALTTVQPGELLFLDSGSTNLALVDVLPDDFDITIATNSIDIAAAVLRRQDLPLVLIGGGVDPLVGGSVDGSAVLALAQMNIDRCFIGACSVSADRGVGAFSVADAAFKRALMKYSNHSVVLATNEKMTAQSHFRVAYASEIECLVLEHDASARDVEALEVTGANILRAEQPRQ